jgi:hypothetical protein
MPSHTKENQKEDQTDQRLNSLANHFKSKLNYSKNKSKGVFLVDGITNTIHTAIINLIIACAVQKEMGQEVRYLCPWKKEDWITHQLYEQVGIKPVPVSSNEVVHKYGIVKEALLSLGRTTDYQSIKIKNVDATDCIVNTTIRNNDNIISYTDAHKYTKLYEVGRATYFHKRMTDIVSHRKIQGGCLGHKYYTPYSIPARVLIANDIDYISRQRTHFKRVATVDQYERNDFALAQPLVDEYREKLGNKTINNYIEARNQGNSSYVDANTAYKDQNYTSTGKNDAVERLLDSSSPCCLIAPHVFSDAPNSDRNMIYTDYCEWFRKTLTVTRSITRSIESVDWFVKAHPSSSRYNEDGYARQMASQYDHVSVLPTDTNTGLCLSNINCVVTVRGTIGMEAILYGANAICAGRSIYDFINGVELCRSEDEYVSALESVGTGSEIPHRSKILAGTLMFYREKSLNMETNILGRERTHEVRGEDRRLHMNKLIHKAERYIRNNSVEESSLYKQIRLLLRGDKKRISFLDIDSD